MNGIKSAFNVVVVIYELSTEKADIPEFTNGPMGDVQLSQKIVRNNMSRRWI